MKIKGSKIGGGSWSSLGLPSIFLLCLFFFLAGLFGSSLFSQQVRLLFFFSFSKDLYHDCGHIYMSFFLVQVLNLCSFMSVYLYSVHMCVSVGAQQSLVQCVRQEMPSNLRPGMREMVEEREIEFEALPRGHSGEESVEAIPFQVY